jgi:hypothetical protein
MLEKKKLLVDKFPHWFIAIDSHLKYVQVAFNISVLLCNLNFYNKM